MNVCSKKKHANVPALSRKGHHAWLRLRIPPDATRTRVSLRPRCLCKSALHDSRPRAFKTHDAPSHAILHPTLPYLRPLPPAPSDDVFSRISLYHPHLAGGTATEIEVTIVKKMDKGTHPGYVVLDENGDMRNA